MNLLFLLIGLALLISGAEIVVRGSVSLGKKLNVSLFAIGIVIVAGGTSLPELASSIYAVANNYSDLAVGAVIGSNIANLILIMAATSFLTPINNINQNQINQAWMNIALAIMIILMSLLLIPFNFLFGIFAVSTLLVIMFLQVKKGVIDVSKVDEKVGALSQGDYSIILSIILIILGIFLLVFGSDLFVASAINIANKFNISEAIIGISLVAFGTSLPELAIGILAAIRRNVDFALGNILGSNIYNVLGVLGISSFFGTFSMPEIIAKQDLFFMLLITLIILGFMFFSKKIGRIYGSIGLILYACYMYFIFI